MRPIWNVRAWLFGCRSRYVGDDGNMFYCSLRRSHDGQHEAHTCGCLGWWDGCAEGPVEAWFDHPGWRPRWDEGDVDNGHSHVWSEAVPEHRIRVCDCGAARMDAGGLVIDSSVVRNDGTTP